MLPEVRVGNRGPVLYVIDRRLSCIGQLVVESIHFDSSIVRHQFMLFETCQKMECEV